MVDSMPSCTDLQFGKTKISDEKYSSMQNRGHDRRTVGLYFFCLIREFCNAYGIAQERAEKTARLKT
jgi:hypothetical protein